MLKLYQFSACPFCWKIRVLLNYQGIPYEAIEVNPLTKEELDFTGHKKVPVLRDGATIVTESAQIMDYLNQKYAITPAEAEQAKWCAWVDETLVHHFPPILHKDFKTSFRTIGKITPAGQGGRFKRQMTRLLGAAIMSKVARKKALKLGISDPIEGVKKAVDRWVAEGLQGRAFNGGDAPSIADLSVFGVFRATEKLEVVDIACSHRPAFADWYQQCKQLTAS